MKQKIFSVWEMLLICIILAACQIQPAILSETVNEDEATDVGFCGTPDQIETEFSGTVPLEWYQNLESGQYRLSFTQKTEKGEEKITATFQLK